MINEGFQGKTEVLCETCLVINALSAPGLFFRYVILGMFIIYMRA